MKYVSVSIVMCCMFCLNQPSGKPDLILPFQEIKVLILSKYHLKSVRLAVTGGRLFLPSQTITLHKNLLQVTVQNNNRLKIKYNKQVYFADYCSIESDTLVAITYQNKGKNAKRNYINEINIAVAEKELEIVNTVPVEQFVHSAALAELGPFPAHPGRGNALTELIKAQEIAMRSYIFAFRDRHPSGNYQFCDLTHCMYFPGIIDKGISLTKGEVMVDRSSDFVPAYFHSTCGGRLAGPEGYWPNHRYHKHFARGTDIYPGSKQHLCIKSPHYRWDVEISDNELFSITGIKADTLKVAYNNDGRVEALRITDIYGKNKSVSIAQFMTKAGRTLGWHVIKSNLFKAEKSLRGWKFTGNGLGHGIGMCQWGASRLAEQGLSYREILAFYYNKPLLLKGTYENKQ